MSQRNDAPAATGAAEPAVPATAAAAAAEPAARDEQGGSHYEDVAANYEAAFFYSSTDYRDWVLGHLLHHMRLPDPAARIVDLGGGTGNFTQALGEAAGCAARVLCVDAFGEMLEKALGRDRVEPMLLDAVAFARLPPAEVRYSHVLLKELVHHIPEQDVPALYAGLFAQLEPGGCAVTITRPQEVDYPLFARAREIWREHQPHHLLFTGAMEAAGFEVEVHTHEYPATLAKAAWLAMVRAKFWSTFAHCTPAELEQGIAELEAQHAGQDSVRFTDRLLFLVARKPAAAAAPGAATAAAAAGAAGAAAAAAGSELPPPPQQRGQQGQQGQGLAAPLTPEQVQQYARRGFAGPLDVLSAEEAAQLARRYDDYAAWLRANRGTPGVTGDWRFKSHLLLPWVWELARHPAVVGAASQALGGCRNLLCWSTDWFLKQPGDGGFTGWHQDSTYVALDPPDVVTVWLALTPASPANGCLHFQPGSHLGGQLAHVDTHAPGNLLLKGQTIPELEGVEGECVPLAPGQASLHHIRLAHRSGPAAPDSTPRLGIALRYMAAHVRQSLDPRDSVAVVAGWDTFGLYRLERAPVEVLGAAELAAHATAVAPVYPPGFERGDAK